MKGQGNQQDYGMRIYDPRLGRFLSVDPLQKLYPELTPYQFSNNSPIANIDLDGLENLYYSVKFNKNTGKSQLYLAAEVKSGLNLFPSYYFTYGGNSYYQTDEVSWINKGMGMKMLSDFEGLTENELAKKLAATKTDVQKHRDYEIQHKQEMEQMFQDAFTGAAMYKGITSRKAAVEPTSTANNQATSANGGNPSAAKANTASKPMQPQQVQQAQAKAVGITPNSTNYREVFFNANPSLRGKVWVHHAVEQNNVQKFYPGLFTQTELNSLGNLRGIPNSVNSELHLSKIRLEWNDFYRTHPSSTTTKQQILNKAAEIDLKFGSQFTPPK